MSQVFRCYVEKRPGFDVEAEKTLRELRDQLGIAGLTGLRLFNRYDVEGVDEAVYQAAKPTVFSEPQCDDIYDEVLPALEAGTTLLAVEALPGQYDQRADSCAQCMMLLAGVAKPAVANARVYAMTGSMSQGDLDRIRAYLINPVECREASMDKPATLARSYDTPDHVAVLEGFTTLDEAGLEKLLADYGLAMDLADLKFLQAYFRDEEKRDPTITEVRVVDTYWSDHCRHTTFSTHINSVEIMDQKVAEAYRRYLDARVEVYGKEKASVRPQTLMDMATIGAKTLKKRGLLKNLDESEEINACSIRVKASVDGEEQDWLLMFKNETHNHPTEIEPFGGAATCIGGCIRDPLSGRAYVYQAMRLTG
ncbi:MAG TPA: phosphoribosylformylglycinamidine synthase, partial [Candidatus Acutalibacter stercorigallinarum]|nr:phosphoribosylformylglycinamidine synthase [Candidatus Acutalibacter stercorigallinarum]